jgi:hypothetical protein
MRNLIIIAAAAFLAAGLYIYISPAIGFPDAGEIQVPRKERIPASPISTPIKATLVAAPIKTSCSNSLSELQARSSRPWLMSWSQGVLLRLSGARLSLGESNPARAAGKFLASYASLLGANAAELSPETQRQMSGNVQVLYSQFQAGLPVFNSRINMIFDERSNLIYLSSNVYSGDPVSSAAKTTLATAAKLAADGLTEFRIAHNDGGEPITAAALGQGAHLGYRLIGGNIALVYKFSFTIPNSPLGDMEIFVEDSSGSLLLMRSLSRT